MTPATTQPPMTLRADAMALPIRSHVAACVVTSPPYLGQRIYGGDTKEIGQEASVNGFIVAMVYVAIEVRRILRPDGTWWLVLGDKANGSGGAGGDYNTGGGKAGRPRYGSFNDRSYEKAQFLDVPGKVITSLQAIGWRLRQEIIWDKGQDSRESLAHVGRPRTAHEKIYMLAPTTQRGRFFPEELTETGSVWHFPPAQREHKAHQAPFPDELPRRCILASTEPGDLVVDPFVGSGTTTNVARSLGRRAIGVDLYAREGNP